MRVAVEEPVEPEDVTPIPVGELKDIRNVRSR
jgi:hypothetical protein